MMELHEAPPDPWLPLQEAVDEVVVRVVDDGRPGWPLIVDLARTVFAALKRLRVDVRELYKRVAGLNDRVGTLEAKVDEPGALLSAGLNGAIERLHGKLGELFREEVARLDADDERLAAGIADLVQVCRLQQETLDELAGLIGSEPADKFSRVSALLVHQENVMWRQLIPFITDGRWEAAEALQHFIDTRDNEPA